jgi:salicylate hydroxylase
VTYYVRRGELVNIVAMREAETWVEESWSVMSDATEMLGAFPGVHPDLRKILEQVQQCHKWGLFDRAFVCIGFNEIGRSKDLALLV